MVKMKQITVFLENKSGRLAKITKLLGSQGINIRALTIADTSDFGILRLIVPTPERAVTFLKSEGFAVSETEVIAVHVPDEPGGLAGVLELLEQNQINIEYMYAFVGRSGADAVVVFRVEDDGIDRAVTLLQQHQIKLFDEKDSIF